MSHPITKAVGDDHVDRRQVEVQKWMEPSRTNAPVRLVPLWWYDRQSVLAGGEDMIRMCVAGCFLLDGQKNEQVLCRARQTHPSGWNKGKASDIGGW